MLYALVLAQGAINYRWLFTIGDEFLHPDRVLPVVLALVLVYFTAIQSFVDYHLASEDQPYRLLDHKAKKRRHDLWRFYLDVVIVGLYSFLLLKCHVLIANPGADLAAVFWAFPAMFVLYLLWGVLRGSVHSDAGQPYQPTLLILCGVLYLGLAIAYATLAGGWDGNAIFLGIALLIMIFYRWKNWSQNRVCKEAPRAETAAKPAPCDCTGKDKPESAAAPAS